MPKYSIKRGKEYSPFLRKLEKEYNESGTSEYIKEQQSDGSLLYFEHYVDFLVGKFSSKFYTICTPEIDFEMAKSLLENSYNKKVKDDKSNLYYEDYVLWLESKIV